jgi:hypothetical protein
MRSNSFKERPVGFTAHFPETEDGVQIRRSDVAGGFHFSRGSRKLMRSPRRLLKWQLIMTGTRPRGVIELSCISNTVRAVI